MSETNYLKLKYISLMSTRWFQDFNSNLARLDLLGKAIRVQQGAGLSMAMRTELSDGTLVEAIRAIPNSNSGVDLYLGRPGTGDRVFALAATDPRVTNTSFSMTKTLCSTGNPISVTGGTIALPAGTWDVEAQVLVKVEIETPATNYPRLSVQAELASGIFVLSSSRFTVTHDKALAASGVAYATCSLRALNLPGSGSYDLRLRFDILGSSFVQGDGTAISLSIATDSGNHILATRVA